MKRYLKLIVVLVFTLSVLLSLATAVGATELKTGIGVVQAQGGLRLRAKPNLSAEILAIAQNGDSVVVIRQDGDWYLVNYNLHIGYMHSDYLKITDQKEINLGAGSVDPSVANVRSAPSTGANLLMQVTAGEKVQIIGFDSGWYEIELSSGSGYIRSDLVTLLEKPAGNSGTAAQAGTSSGSTGSKNRSDASSGSSSGSTSGGSSDSSSGSTGAQIAEYAKSFVGYPYVYGGSSPSGFDCSGFMQYVFAHFGYKINRTATAQLSNGYSVSYNELQPGDIIYFGYGSVATHVGMYIGNGQFVHAANSRTGVVITSLSESWYANRYLCAHRIVG